MSLKQLISVNPSEVAAAPTPCPCVAQKPQQEMKPPGTYMRENGLLMLVDKFDQEKVMPLVAAIYEYNLMPDGLRPEEINLIINSPGGSLHSAFHLVDAMEMSDIPVNTIGSGLVASAGVFTLMAGAHRSLTPNTAVMSHQYSYGSVGKEHELKAKVKEFDLSSERMMNHYKKFTKKSETYIRRNLLQPSDVWLTPEECKKHNIIDEILA